MDAFPASGKLGASGQGGCQSLSIARWIKLRWYFENFDGDAYFGNVPLNPASWNFPRILSTAAASGTGSAPQDHHRKVFLIFAGNFNFLDPSLPSLQPATPSCTQAKGSKGGGNSACMMLPQSGFALTDAFSKNHCSIQGCLPLESDTCFQVTTPPV